MDYAAKQSSNDKKTTERNAIEDQSHSLAKDKISDILRGSDYESCAKSAEDEAVGSPVSSSITATNKQSISQKSHIRDILTSPAAVSVPESTRTNIENKYGADFSNVNFYQDDRSTKSVNAKAYTYGTDIVFSPNHYKPNTSSGEKLIAHELAHVVQQNQSGVMQLQRDEAKPGEIPADQLADYNDTLNDILPKKTIIINGEKRGTSGGLLHHIFITGILVDTFKDDKKIGALTRAIAANEDAKKVSRKYGICGIMALHDANLDATKAVELLTKQKQFYSLDAIIQRSKNAPGKIIEKTLSKVNRDSESGAKAADAYSNVDNDEIEASWALTLSKENIGNLKQLLPLLAREQMLAKGGKSRFKQSKSDIRSAYDKLRDCKTEYNKRIKKGITVVTALRMARDARDMLNAAKDNLALASTSGINGLDSIFRKLCGKADKLSKIVKEWSEFRQSQKDTPRTQRKSFELDTDKIDDLRDDLRRLIDSLNLINVTGSDKSITRISLLIRYFIALNDENYDNAPTLADLKKHVNDFDEISSDLDTLTGRIIVSKFELYTQLATVIKKQVETREGMNDKTGEDPGFHPSRENIEKYFKALKKSSNDDAISAYEAYAQGFFQHRVQAPKEREDHPTTDEIYGFPVTIGGTRMVVCAGYAQLGKYLFELAGAKFKEFLIWSEFSRDDLRSGDINSSSSHMVTRLVRKRKSIYVSNDKIYPSAKAAFESVGYTGGNGTYLVKGKGKTAKEASSSFAKDFDKKKKKLQR